MMACRHRKTVETMGNAYMRMCTIEHGFLAYSYCLSFSDKWSADCSSTTGKKSIDSMCWNIRLFCSLSFVRAYYFITIIFILFFLLLFIRSSSVLNFFWLCARVRHFQQFLVGFFLAQPKQLDDFIKGITINSQWSEIC